MSLFINYWFSFFIIKINFLIFSNFSYYILKLIKKNSNAYKLIKEENLLMLYSKTFVIKKYYFIDYIILYIYKKIEIAK